MILIADSGSTKTSWLVQDKGAKFYFETIGLNPYHVDSSIVEKELYGAFPKNITKESISNIYFYGSGCSNPKINKEIENGLKAVCSKADVVIENDMLGACRALYGDEAGVAVILGTGSNSCYFSNNRIQSKQISLGYILGDEGSGAVIGKNFISGIYTEKFTREVVEAFEKEYNFNDILNSVYKTKLPNRYLSSLMPFIHKNIANQQIKEFVQQEFLKFIDIYLMNYPSTKVRAVGSIAYYFKNELSYALNSRNLILEKVIRNPLSSLASYHLD